MGSWPDWENTPLTVCSDICPVKESDRAVGPNPSLDHLNGLPIRQKQVGGGWEEYLKSRTAPGPLGIQIWPTLSDKAGSISPNAGFGLVVMVRQE